MSINLIDTANTWRSYGDTFTLTPSEPVLENDILIVVYNGNYVPDCALAAFTIDLPKDSGIRPTVMSRVASASEPTSYVFTLAGNTRLTATLRVYRGVSTGSIYDVAPAVINTQAGTSNVISAPSITTSTDGAIGVLAVGTGFHSEGAITFGAADNGYSNVEQNPNSHASATFDKSMATAGATGVSTVTYTSTTPRDWYGLQFALAPSEQIIDIDGDNIVTPNQTAVITMTGGADTAATATFGGVACTFTGSATATTRPVIIPTSLPYGAHDLVVDGVITLANVTLVPEASNQVVIVSDVDLSDNSLFYNSNLPVEDGWQWELPTLTNEGKVIAPHPSGTVVIENTGIEVQTFDYRVYDFTAEAWSEYATATITPVADIPVITNIDTDNVVYPNQTATINMRADGDTAVSVTLGGSACTLTGTATATTRPVIIPTDLPYGLHQLIVETA